MFELSPAAICSQVLPKTAWRLVSVEGQGLLLHSRRMIQWSVFLLLAQATATPDPSRLASELDTRAADLYRQGRYDEAAHHQRQSLGLWKEIARTRPVNLAAPHANLAHTYLAQGKLSAAEKEAQVARQLASEAERARISLLFAGIHFQTGEYRQAEQEMRAALPELTGISRATTLNDLGMIRAALGDLSEARRLMESALAIREEVQAVWGGEYGRILGNLALVCFRQGDLAASESNYSAAIPMLERALGPEHPHLGMALAEYGQVLRKSGRKSEAKIYDRRARIVLALSPDWPGRQTIDIRSLR